MKYSGYWLSIMETNLDNHMLHTFLSCNLSFPSLSPVISLITPINDGPVLMDFTFGRLEQFQNYAGLTSDVPKLLPPQSTLLCTTLYSNAVIDIDNCLDTYHLNPWHLFSLRSLASTAKRHCLHFEISNMDLVSYCILINFTNIHWPDMFCKLPIVY